MKEYKKLGEISNSLNETLYEISIDYIPTPEYMLEEEEEYITEEENKLFIIVNKTDKEETLLFDIIHKLKYNLLNINNTKSDIINQIQKLLKTHNTPEWVNCKNDCFNVIKNSIDLEINTTLYYLITLTQSLLCLTDNKFIICFKFNDFITGNWEIDYLNVNMNVLEYNIETNTYELQNCVIDTSRLIMGFGPSASGKTYIAKKIINLMSLITPTFPQFFLSIDGGTYRETCKTYKEITTQFPQSRTKGLENLVCSTVSIFKTCKSLFKSDVIKKNIKIYLEQQKYRYNFVISLYVPDTIAFCGDINCENKYKFYKNYTEDDEWVGTLIYQHKTAEVCNHKGNVFQCVGTTQSGKSREITEGKKYSSDAWNASFNNGYNEFKKAKFAFKIHNCGRRPYPDKRYIEQPKSIIIDYSTPQIIITRKIYDFFKNNYFVLLNKNETQVNIARFVNLYSSGGKTKHKKSKRKNNKSKRKHNKSKDIKN
jgi:hypothetical protein